MKYVAFLDILGFKNKLRSQNQLEAKQFIGDFSRTIYSVFNGGEFHDIHGYVVSDSVILHTSDTASRSLIALYDLIQQICQKEFVEHGILIRGAIAKGEFDKMPAAELPNLQKGLMVGQAYVDAYLLEGSVKSIGINLSEPVYQDIRECYSSADVVDEKFENQVRYIMRTITVDTLLEPDSLRQFVSLANASEWLPHYYNTLHFALKLVNSDGKVNQVFDNIFHLLRSADDSGWRKIDRFVENAFQSEVISHFKTRFLRYIRTHLQ